MSDRFSHFLFDEFQDTSTLQFKALAPLIDEVLSRREKASLFIVGDRKQAIYRWRGGNSELMDESALKEEIPAIDNLAPGGFSRYPGQELAQPQGDRRFQQRFLGPRKRFPRSRRNPICSKPSPPISRTPGRISRPTRESAGGYVELSLHDRADETRRRRSRGK